MPCRATITARSEVGMTPQTCRSGFVSGGCDDVAMTTYSGTKEFEGASFVKAAINRVAPAALLNARSEWGRAMIAAASGSMSPPLPFVAGCAGRCGVEAGGVEGMAVIGAP